jgi:outer membrane lipoprotein
MRRDRSITFLAALVLLAVAACAPSFSREFIERVDRNVTFSELQNNPVKYKGTWIMLGGVIIETRNTQEGTSIEVLETPLDRQGRPYNTDATRGRFIIESPQFLDAAVYHQGKPISVIGEAANQEVRPLGNMNYRYPVITEKEIRLWEPRTGPRFSFGVGIGVFHRF